MTAERGARIEQLLWALLPADGSPVGNARLLRALHDAGRAEGLRVAEADFQAARQALLAAARAVKGKGRGGATARAAGAGDPGPASAAAGAADDAEAEAERPAFELHGGPAQADLPVAGAAAAGRQSGRGAGMPAGGRRGAAAPGASGTPGTPQVLSYRHADRRVNNPEVGLVSEASDPAAPKTAWAYDPHLDPVLQWAGKAERTSFEVDTVSLHVHERVDPMSILAAVAKGRQRKGGAAGAAAQGFQPGLFEAPFESLPLRDAVDFYRHDKGWSNRLVAGDSLLVMNSLLVKEGLAGQVQMIYIDPPYGIRYGSNFQPFVNKRDVKDRADADLTAEPEMIKAFRDTWELGIHSYLSYLRDRLLLARELLSETGSVFVQISDENLHHVREVMDEVLGAQNFVAVISFQTTASTNSPQARTLTLSRVFDFIVWYAKDKPSARYKQLFQDKESGGSFEVAFSWVQMPTGDLRRISKDAIAAGGKVLALSDLTGQNDNQMFAIRAFGSEFLNRKRGWRTTSDGIDRLLKASRVVDRAGQLRYRNFLDDFPVTPINNNWSDTGAAAFLAEKVYVVETNVKVIERCLQMTTDPGDLVLDPTCGSGTTAYVAEKWGRRWISCDTSRVAITLAKTRLMTASFDYYELRYPHEGLKGGFIYKTVPHVTLKSIANNPEIDAIHERLHPAIEKALAELNAALRRHPPPAAFTVTEGARKGQALDLGRTDLLEWEVPFPADGGAAPAGWPEPTQAPFAAFHAARARMQAEMDRSIAAHADSETLYDQPEKSRRKLRVTGPFSVEAVPFPTVLALDAGEAAQAPGDAGFSADAAVARSGATSRHAQWRDELLKTGIRARAGQMLRFAALDTLAGTTCLHCSGTLAAEDGGAGEPAVVSFGPEHGALEQRQVEHAIGEAAELFPRPKFIVFCAFAFDPEAAKDIDAMKGITALKAQMNTDLLTEDLKKARAGNQSFWLMGQPEVLLHAQADGRWRVEVNGFDYFDTVRGELVSGGKSRIALWSLDTDYDGRSLFPHQVFFPMAGKGEGWEKLKKDIRAELDESRLDAYRGTLSLPFGAGVHRRVAVKIVDDRGIESLKVMGLPAVGPQDD